MRLTFRSNSARPFGVTVVAAFMGIEPDYSLGESKPRQGHPEDLGSSHYARVRLIPVTGASQDYFQIIWGA
jgi:hypothetical protein